MWSGPVGVTVESRSGRPEEVDTSWEDIAEFSAIVDEGPLVLCGITEMPMPGWPRVDGFGLQDWWKNTRQMLDVALEIREPATAAGI